jgi:hypothetical protein
MELLAWLWQLSVRHASRLIPAENKLGLSVRTYWCTPVFTLSSRLCHGSVISLSLRRPEFVPGWVHVGFVVEKAALGQVFLRVLQFPLSVSFHQGSILVYVTGDEQDCWMPTLSLCWLHKLKWVGKSVFIQVKSKAKLSHYHHAGTKGERV